MAKKRDIAIDNIKAFTIILVVWGHSMQYLQFEPFEGYDRMFLNPANTWIYLFHMPLFVFLSGIFHKNAVPMADFFYKTFNRLVLPMIIWAIPCTMYNYWVENVPLSVSSYISVFKYAWWFIWVIVECKITLYMLSRIKTKWISIILVLLLYVLYPYVQRIIPRYNLYLSCVPFYLVGYYYAQYQETIMKKWGAKGEVFFSPLGKGHVFLYAIILLLISLIWNKNYAMYWADYKLTNLTNLWYFTVRCTAGFCGILLCLSVFKKHLHNANIITFLGKETFGIYILQFFYCSVLQLGKIKVDNIFAFYVISVVLSFVCLVISISIIKLIRRSTTVSKLLLG